MNKHKKMENILGWVILILVILVIGILSYINIFHFNYKMNSDLASNVQLARLMWQYKTIIPKSWIFSSEIIIINPATLAAIIYGLLGNMNLSMGLSCCLFMYIECALLYRLCRCLKMSKISSCLTVLTFLVIPGNMTNLENLFLFAAYYSEYIITILLFLTGYARTKNGDKKFPIELLLSDILIIILSISGVRIALMLTAPMLGVVLAGSMITLIFNRDVSKLYKDNKKIFTVVILSFLISLFGFISPFSVQMDTSRNIRHAGEKFVNEVIPAFLDVICIHDNSSFVSVINITVLLTVIFICLLMVIKYINDHIHGHESSTIDVVSLFFLSTILLTMFMNVFTTSMTSSRYYIMYYLLAALIVGYISEKMVNFEILHSLYLGFVSIVMIYISLFFSVPVITSNPLNEVTEKIVQIMEDYDCYMGYSSFESSARISVESNNRVQIAAIDDFSKMNISRWLTDENWYVPNLPQNMHTAYLIHSSWEETFDNMLDMHDDIILIGQAGDYKIYYSDINYSNLGDSNE